jgi:hypothetical protein
MKSSLQAMGAVLRRQAFDCFDRSSIAPQREHEAGWHRLAVGEDGASTTLASVAADLRARQARGLAQIIDQKLVFGDGIVTPSAVKPQMDELFLGVFRLPLRHDWPAIATAAVTPAKALFACGAMTKIKSPG